MKEEYPPMQGVVTFEQPFAIHRDGVSFRGKVALVMGKNFSREACDTIAKSLNIAFQEGFCEGQAALSKILQK